MASPLTVLVTGGAGYVGAELVPRLLASGYKVRVLDLFLFDRTVFDDLVENPALDCIVGDIRDRGLLRSALRGVDVVIHLACISNDPSFELDPRLSKSINFDAFEPLVRIARDSGVQRFIYASTSSVYGVSDAPEVREDHPLVPLTSYNKYKGLCEPILLEQQSPDFCTVVIRPATVCGFSRRMRLDLSVNILTDHAVNRRCITIFGGRQMRPNVHIEDICELYADLIELPSSLISGEIFNVGRENSSLLDLGQLVRRRVGALRPDLGEIPIEVTQSTDPRSYHICSEKIRARLGYQPRHSIGDAIDQVIRAFGKGLIPDSQHIRYFNVKALGAASYQ